MTGLFAFDGPMYKDRNGIYCNTTITNEMFSRYFVVVDKLYVLIRTIYLENSYESLNLKKVEVGDNLEIVECPNFNSPINFIIKFRYFDIITKYVQKSDLIFLRIPSIISNMTAYVCKKYDKPYLAEVGGCAWDSYFNHGLIGKLVAPYMFFKQKNVVKHAALASYVTEKWLQKRYPTQAKSIIASNVYLKEFNETKINRRIINFSKRKPINYTLGTIASVEVKYKGQEFIIKALGQLRKKGIILHYDLVGAGDPKYLKKIAKKYGVDSQVHFVGLLLHDDIWQWLDKVDIYAQPSKQEGLPRALIEAMNRGCLTIGSNVAGIPELLEPDTVFESGNVNQIVKILKNLLDETNHTHRIIRNFKKSKEFDKNLLEQRRQTLFLQYRDLIMEYGKRQDH